MPAWRLRGRRLPASMLRHFQKPEPCRARHRCKDRAPLSLVLVLSLCCTIGAQHASGDLEDCDWTVTSETGDRQRLTQDEVEAELVRELAVKLRQFDRCLAQDAANAANAVTDAESGGTDGGQAGVASNSGGGQQPGDGAGLPRPGMPAQASHPTAAAGNQAGPGGDGDDKRLPAGPASPGATSAAAPERTEGPGLPGGGDRGRDNVVEDDVARILREAAERETDPTRRAALWKEYENYVQNL